MPIFRSQPAGLALLTLGGTLHDGQVRRVFNGLRRLLTSRRPPAGLVLRLASEGGSVAAAQAVVELVRQLEAETGARVVTVVDDIAVSAAYYVALAGERVFVQPGAVLGSIGTVINRYDLSALARRVGVEDVSVTSDDGKRAGQSMVWSPRFADPQAGAALVEDIHAQFEAWVLERRGLQTLPDVARHAASFSGRMAVQNGLADEEGGTAAAISFLVRELGLARFELLEVDAEASWLARLVQGLPMGGLLARWMGLA
ncbi:S49 family peptidase [Roseateles sp. DXS20W]|uniref:S49 family peptidase n=1 Tax=Pelomonas lactea TaxID=3299030 RepID=A0ABW7GS75_9BURK